MRFHYLFHLFVFLDSFFCFFVKQFIESTQYQLIYLIVTIYGSIQFIQLKLIDHMFWHPDVSLFGFRSMIQLVRQFQVSLAQNECALFWLPVTSENTFLVSTHSSVI